jgi:type II secretory pathway component GspD/PulD (secretin)
MIIGLGISARGYAEENKASPTTKPAQTTTSPASQPATGTQPAVKPAESSKPAKPKKIGLSFKNAPIDQIAKFLNKHMGKPVIIANKDVEGKKITLLNPETLLPDEALDILMITLHEYGIAVEEREQTLHLIPIEQIKQAQIPMVPAEKLEKMKRKCAIVRTIFEIKNYDPSELLKVLNELKPKYGHIMVDPQTSRQLIAVATVERLIAMSRVITELDQPEARLGDLKIFHINNTDVYEIIPNLSKLIAAYLDVDEKAITTSTTSVGRSGSSRRGPSSSGDSKAIAGTVTIKAENKTVLLIPDVRKKILVVSAPYDLLNQIASWLEILDVAQPSETPYEIVEIEYIDAEDIANRLTDLLNVMPDESLRNAVRIIPFATSRRLMVVGSAQNRAIINEWIKQFDVSDTGVRITETFVLKYADAQEIADNIEELFESGGFGRGSAIRIYGSYYGSRGGGADRSRVTVTANTRNNSITVVASPEKMTQIKEQIKEWDQPLAGEDVLPLIITLKYADPQKTKDLLESLFTKKERESTGYYDFWYGSRDSTTQSPVGRLFGQFRFEAYPETGKLIVVSKNEENYKYIEEMVARIDQPQVIGLPRRIQLKFADAETLAEQLNSLLNAPGTPASILRRQKVGTLESISGQGSPLSQQAQNQQQRPNQQQQQQRDGQGQMQFWWQNLPPSTELSQAKQPSNLIGKLRIVPNIEQNALLVIAPEEYADAIEKFVRDLDQPGYQVLIKAAILEITHDDSTSLGYRFSTDPSLFIGGDPLITENALRGLIEYNFTDNFGQQHSFSLNVDVNNLISMLRRVTDLKIVSEPKILTADNIEGQFFDGQDIPFLLNSRLTDAGLRDDTFEYMEVGIRLRVRPHITKESEIDLAVDLLVSNIVPGRTLFGGAIVDRRQTTTNIVLEDGKTFMISGILREEDRAIVRRIPGLGDIPLLGELFKHREIAKVNTELMILLTPYVIRPDEPAGHDPIESDPQERMEELHPPNEGIGKDKRPETESTNMISALPEESTTY